MNNQPAEHASHTTISENLIWARDNGYVRRDDVVAGRYEFERHGNPEQWIDIRWSMADIQRHHREYVIQSRLAYLDRVDPIWEEGQK